MRTRGSIDIGRGIALGLGLLAASAGAGCDDPFAAFLTPVPDEPTRISLVDFRTGPLQRTSAYDLLNGVAVRVDQTSGWDFLFYVTEAGQPQLRPFGAATSEENGAGLQRVTVGFDALRSAPDEDYVRTEAVSIEEGAVLAAVSRRGSNGCRRFAKIEILEIDADAGTLEFQELTNPNCELRGLVPGETGAEDA